MLGRIVAAARLMGARAVLAGLQPNVVVTLGEMGIGLEGVATALSLEEGLEALGVNVTRDDDDLAGAAAIDDWLEGTGGAGR
jgi:rsbT antagonist protein RsbS